MIIRTSSRGYHDTADALVRSLDAHGLTLFARIDHAAGAREAGLELAQEEVVLFGNALSGTPLMQSDPRIGIDLPLRILLWREGERVMIGYRDPRELAAGYAVEAHLAILERMAALLEQLASEAGGET